MEGRIGAAEAARRLGVKPATLYAYVSRGLLTRWRDPGSRTSWFDPAEVERLAARQRDRPARRGGPELVIESALTTIEAGRLWYRSHDAIHLAARHSFEEVAWLLWTGDLAAPAPWQADQTAVAVASAAQAALPPGTLPLERLRVIAAALAPSDELRFELHPSAVIATAPSLLAGLVEGLPPPVDNAGATPSKADGLASGGPPEGANAPIPAGGPAAASTPGGRAGSIAARLWGRLCAAPAELQPELTALLDDALVLLADHELAASTLAARVAASVRADPYAVVSVGLGALSGALHGAASLAVEDLLAEASEPAGAAAAAMAARAVGERLRRGERLRGFGLALYPDGDPRAAFLLERLRAAGHAAGPAASARLAVVEAVLATARRLGQPPPNVDFALGALATVSGMVRGAGEAIFAIGRTAGWLAHALEEYRQPRPLRPRARYTGPPPAP